MLFIVDKRIPGEAKCKLLNYGELLELYVGVVTYEAIAGHPDIFFCKSGKQLITAPNLPDEYKNILEKRNINYVTGKNNVGYKYPESAVYNAVLNENYLIHKLSITDWLILNTTDHLKKINIQQGYSRCSLLPLKDNSFITSDKGIFKTLSEEKLDVIYVSPEEIILPGFSYGFFGGACGIYENKIFITGNLRYFSGGGKVRSYLLQLGYEIIELYDGPLFDGGSIIVV